MTAQSLPLPPFFPNWAAPFWEADAEPWTLTPCGASQTEVWTFRPSSPEALAELIKGAYPSSGAIYVTGPTVVIPPEGRWLDQNAVAVDLSPLDQITEWTPADFVVGVETGITLGALNEQLAAHGQVFPLMYPSHWTLADILASDLPAINSGSRGYVPRDTVLGLTVITAEGERTRCGGRVMKNVTGYDLNKLYCGAQHTLGLMVHSFLKLDPLPEQVRGFLYPMESLEEGINQGEALHAKTVPGLQVATLLHRSRLPQSWIERYELLDETPLVLWVELAGMAPVVEAAETQLAGRMGPGFVLSEADRQELLQGCYPTVADCKSPVMACLEVRVSPLDLSDVLATWLALCPEGGALVPWTVDLLEGGIYLPIPNFGWDEAFLDDPEDKGSRFLHDSTSVLWEFQQALQKLGGFFRVCALSPALGENQDALTPWIRRWNLPDGGSVAMWMDRLKETLDHTTVFPSVLLPLGTRYQTLEHAPHLV